MRKTVGALYLCAGMFLAGSSVVVGKIVVGEFPVFISQVITLTIALILIFPLAWIKEGSVFKMHFEKRDIGLMAMQALTGMFLFRVFLLNGLKYTSAAESGIITSLGPAVLTILAFWMLKERVTVKAWIGILICIFGVLVINLTGATGNDARGMMRYAGNFLVFLAVTGEALFTVFRKKISYTDRAVTSTMLIIFFALLMFLPMAAVESHKFNFVAVTGKSILPLAVYGVFCTVLAYICWFEGVARTNTSMAAGFTGVMPVSSVILSAIVLGEQIRWTHILGTLLVVAGIYTISMRMGEKQSDIDA